MTQIGLNTNKIANFKSNELIQAQQNPQIQQVGVEPQILPEVQLPDLYLSNIESVDKSLTFKDKLKKWDYFLFNTTLMNFYLNIFNLIFNFFKLHIAIYFIHNFKIKMLFIIAY